MSAPEEAVIRPAEPADAEGVAALLGLPGTFEGTLQLPDMPLASRLDWTRPDPQSCKLVALAGGAVVGWGALHHGQSSLRRHHVRSVSLAISPQWQGRGLGRRLMQRLLHWADRWTHTLRIELMVHADNERAIALYRSLGFAEEGRHRGYALKDGHYVDSLSMARLHPNPPRLPSTAAG
jgi:L-phenylalanine/L-methionine N-acetyltransferase